MNHHRDTVTDRIGNTIRSIGKVSSLTIAALGLGWGIRGEVPIITPGADVDVASMFVVALFVWVIFDTLDYLITGRK